MEFTLLEKFVLLCACHVIGDFAFQTAWLAEGKKISWGINAYHAFAYTSPFVLLLLAPAIGMTVAALAVIAGSHFVIDPLKARYGIIKWVWLDQFLHVIVLVALLLFVLT